jgi:hypothetical protein
LSWRIGEGFIGMPLIGDSQKTTTTDTARTAAMSNVEFPLPVYHRLASRQVKNFTKRLMRMKSVSHLASHYHHLVAPALRKLIFAGGRNKCARFVFEKFFPDQIADRTISLCLIGSSTSSIVQPSPAVA